MLASTLLACVLSQATVGDGRAALADFGAGRIDDLWHRASPDLKEEAGSPEGLDMLLSPQRRYGNRFRVIDETFESDGGTATYTCTGAYTMWARGVEATVQLNDEGQVDSISLKPATCAASSDYEDYRQKTKLHLPVTRPFQVLWGGRTWEDNRHAAVPDMRYALDLWVEKDGSTSHGSGRYNKQYYCYGLPVLAPASGVVVSAHDGVFDNRPNHIDSKVLYGNHLVIAHGHHEFSLLAHLKRGSLEVKRGDKVKRGQVLARVGNSGFSTEPHLHWHLMNAADWRLADGLPASFCNYLADGQPVPLGEPARGQTIAPDPHPAGVCRAPGDAVDGGTPAAASR